MGSTGSGSFSDYSGRKPTEPDLGNGGASKIDPCTQAFNASLEEVNRCFYFINHTDVPPVGTQVRIRFNGVRLAAETMLGEEIGYLPTRLNFLKVCMSDGFAYEGRVRSSATAAVSTVDIDCRPI